MWPFRKTDRQSVVLIDITASSVGGAYAHYQSGQPPTLYFTCREQVHAREGETLDAAMLRALDAVGKTLIEKGAPVLRRETGDGHVDRVVISVGAPWQDARVTTHHIAPGKQFTFSKRMVSEVLAAEVVLPEGHVRAGTAPVAILLNGYVTPHPIGMQAKRAEIVVLSTSLAAETAELIRTKLRALYHAHDIQFAAFPAVSYAAMRALYPHQKDFFLLEIGEVNTDLALIKGSMLADTGTLPYGIRSLMTTLRAAERMSQDEEMGTTTPVTKQPGYTNPSYDARFSTHEEEARKKWLTELTDLLKVFAERNALPRTLFLLTDPVSREYLTWALQSPILHALWLSDEPLSILPVLPEHLAPQVRTLAEADADLYLALLALYQGTQGQ